MVTVFASLQSPLFKKLGVVQLSPSVEGVMVAGVPPPPTPQPRAFFHSLRLEPRGAVPVRW